MATTTADHKATSDHAPAKVKHMDDQRLWPDLRGSSPHPNSIRITHSLSEPDLGTIIQVDFPDGHTRTATNAPNSYNPVA